MAFQCRVMGESVGEFQSVFFVLVFGLVLCAFCFALLWFWFWLVWSSVGFELWIEFASGQHKLNPFGKDACLLVFE